MILHVSPVQSRGGNSDGSRPLADTLLADILEARRAGATGKV
jgi:hypothetical protein